MAFPTGWTKRVAITVPAAQVGSGGVSDFDVALTEDNLPAAIFTDARGDGGDVRFSIDEAGATQLAWDQIHWNVSGTALLRVGPISLSSAAANTIYCWYGKADETLPARDSTYGGENAYAASLVGYWPMDDDPTGVAPQMLDRTSNDNDGSVQGTWAAGDLVAAKLLNGYDFDGSANADTGDGVTVADSAELDLSDGSFSLQGWVKYDVVNGKFRWQIDKSTDNSDIDYTFGLSSTNNVRLLTRAASNSIVGSTTVVADTWYHITGVQDTGDTEVRLYLNASSDATPIALGGAATTNAQPVRFGVRNNDTGFHDGPMDEWRIQNVAINQATITTRYNNENDPASFATAGTPEDPTSEDPPTPQVASGIAAGRWVTGEQRKPHRLISR